MPYISFSKREISFKVVYYGPGMSGKTTNLVFIHRALRPEAKGELVTLSTADERTLFFDFFPVELGQSQGSPSHEPDICVTFTDKIAGSGRLRLIGLNEAAFDDENFYLLDNAGRRSGRYSDNSPAFSTKMARKMQL